MTQRRIKSNVSVLSRTWAAVHLHWRALMAARSARGPAPREPQRGHTPAGHEHGVTEWAHDAAHRAQHVAHDVAHEVAHKAHDVAHRAQDVAHEVAHKAHDIADDVAHDVAQDVDHWTHGHPLLERPRRPILRAFVYGAVALVCLGGMATAGLWWRLGSGPVAFDVVTPWLTAAIEERFGGRHHVEVGGTQIERDENGRTAIRLVDVVVRDRNGVRVASAPKAEVGISPAGLLSGQVQAVRLSLIGARMDVRVESDGRVSVFAGADSGPLASAPVIAAIPQVRARQSPSDPAPAAGPAPVTGQGAQDAFTALLAWLDGIEVLGLDGRDLTEIGLKSGILVVDDRRSNKKWTFDNINLSLTRPKEGGVALTMSSSGTDGPWSLTATVTPRGEGRRAIEAVIRDVSPKDILLALRVGEGLEADMPLSAIVRAELSADGAVQSAEGRVIAGAGFIGHVDDPKSRILIDEAQMNWRWDPATRTLAMPIEIQSGANRISLLGQFEPPRETGGTWAFSFPRGSLLLASNEHTREPPMILDRVLLRGRFDPAKRRIDIEQGEVAGLTAGFAFSGSVDYSDEPRLSLGMAATRMSIASFKRLWPVFLSPDLKSWVVEHIPAGTVERVVIATNAPLNTLRAGGPPVPNDGLSVEIVANVTVRAIDGLPPVRDIDLLARITGRTATLTIGRGVLELPSGRKLTISNGLFEIPDTDTKPSPARMRMRIDGTVDAAAELASMEPLRSAVGLQLDPATLRGTVGAQLMLAWPLMDTLPKGALNYTIDADITNFSAERLVRGLKAEAASLKFTANPQGFQLRGDAKIGNAMVAVDYRKPTGNADAEVRAQTVLDDAARTRLGFDLGGGVTGPVPVKFSGRVATGEGDNRFAVDADLTQARIADLLPGWIKLPGKAARATFILTEKAQSRRFDDLVLEGAGVRVRGMLEIDAQGEIIAANFPVFALADGDKASIKAERGPDGTLRVTMRGEVYDGRAFIKAALTGADAKKRPTYDLDLDVKIGAVAGFHGEALRNLELRTSRRQGEIRSFVLNARLSRDAALVGDMRGVGGRQVLNFVTDDAGALFRFNDMYPRMVGGNMSVTIDPPTADRAPQQGVVTISEFNIRGEQALDRIAASAPPNDAGPRPLPGSHGVDFSRMRIEFTRSPGRIAIREGYVWGTAVGATMDGVIDFAREDVHLRGTFVPGYSLNNLPAQVLPLFGTLLTGGKNEGLLGVTYEVVGPPGAMILRVNPMSIIAPGFLRKLFEFRRHDGPMWSGPDAPR